MRSTAARCAGLLDGPALVAFLSATGTPVTEAQLRQWARRGHVRRRGRDEHRRTLYDVAEVARHASGAARRPVVA